MTNEEYLRVWEQTMEASLLGVISGKDALEILANFRAENEVKNRLSQYLRENLIRKK